MRATSWHDFPAWTLETDAASVVIIPALGAKIVSLRDRRRGLEWLAGPIPGRPLRPVPYAAPFEQQDMSGWDEMFPTIVACRYPGPGPLVGTPLPDHGEAWALPWTVVKARDDELVLALAGRALPYRLTRRAHFAGPDVLHLHYRLENLGAEPLPYLWSAHPQFLAGPDCQILLPPGITTVVNTLPAQWGWGAPESTFTWPDALAPDGRYARLDAVGPAALGRARKFFALPAARPAWVALDRPAAGCRLRLEWNPAEVPYFGLWVDEGAINPQAVVAPEPGTGWYDDLALAWQKQEVTVLAAGAVAEWTLTVRLEAEEGRNRTP